MNDWLPFLIIIAAFILIIGSLSTFQKSSRMPLRKKSLNELKETLPRTHKKNQPDNDKPKDKEKNN